MGRYTSNQSNHHQYPLGGSKKLLKMAMFDGKIHYKWPCLRGKSIISISMAIFHIVLYCHNERVNLATVSYQEVQTATEAVAPTEEWVVGRGRVGTSVTSWGTKLWKSGGKRRIEPWKNLKKTWRNTGLFQMISGDMNGKPCGNSTVCELEKSIIVHNDEGSILEWSTNV